MESRTGCDTRLSSPGQVGYLRTFTPERPLPPLPPLSGPPSRPSSPSATKQCASDQCCVSCGHHVDFSLEEIPSPLGHANPVSHFWLPALVWMS